MEKVMIFAAVLAPILTALMQVVKSSFTLPKNHVPLISLALGAGIGAAAASFTDLDLVMRVWAGGFAGLSSVGLFELFNHRNGITK